MKETQKRIKKFPGNHYHKESGKEKVKQYSKNNKESLQIKASDRCRELSNEEKDKKEIMEKTDTRMCLKKINEKRKNMGKSIIMQKITLCFVMYSIKED